MLHTINICIYIQKPGFKLGTYPKHGVQKSGKMYPRFGSKGLNLESCSRIKLGTNIEREVQ